LAPVEENVSNFVTFGTSLKNKNYVRLEVSAAIETYQVFLDDFNP